MRLLNFIFSAFGEELTKKGLTSKVVALRRKKSDLSLKASQADAMKAWVTILIAFPPAAERALPLINSGKSQIGQDLFALIANEFKTNGYFLEIGASNGISLSNTYLLEKQLGWSGLLVEPAKMWHEELEKSRSSAVDKRAVWSANEGDMQFLEANVLSTLKKFEGNDAHIREGHSYPVPTVTPSDLLSQHKSPTRIDFLSIDTEGSELEILKSFPFKEYDVTSICVEHNFTSNRAKIDSFL